MSRATRTCSVQLTRRPGLRGELGSIRNQRCPCADRARELCDILIVLARNRRRSPIFAASFAARLCRRRAPSAWSRFALIVM